MYTVIEIKHVNEKEIQEFVDDAANRGQKLKEGTVAYNKLDSEDHAFIGLFERADNIKDLKTN